MFFENEKSLIIHHQKKMRTTQEQYRLHFLLFLILYTIVYLITLKSYIS